MQPTTTNSHNCNSDVKRYEYGTRGQYLLRLPLTLSIYPVLAVCRAAYQILRLISRPITASILKKHTYTMKNATYDVIRCITALISAAALPISAIVGICYPCKTSEKSHNLSIEFIFIENGFFHDTFDDDDKESEKTSWIKERSESLYHRLAI